MAKLCGFDAAVDVSGGGVTKGRKKSARVELLGNGILRITFSVGAQREKQFHAKDIAQLPHQVNEGGGNYFLTMKDGSSIFISCNVKNQLKEFHSLLTKSKFDTPTSLCVPAPHERHLIGTPIGAKRQLTPEASGNRNYVSEDTPSNKKQKQRNDSSQVQACLQPNSSADVAHGRREYSSKKFAGPGRCGDREERSSLFTLSDNDEPSDLEMLHESTPTTSAITGFRDKENTPKNGIPAGNFYGPGTGTGTGAAQRQITEFISSCVTTNSSNSSNKVQRIRPLSTLVKRQPVKTYNDENELSWKSEKLSLGTGLHGFSNLGNTCYMNAILQALFSIEPFEKEIFRCYTSLETVGSVETKKLFSSFTKLLKFRNTEKLQKDRYLRQVKEAISSTAARFSGYSQHDAHEFLGQVLDQMKEEINALGVGLSVAGAKSRPNPVSVNFEFSVCHSIRCKGCNRLITKEESFHDLSLDLLTASSNDVIEEEETVSLQFLLDAFFAKEEVNYRCENEACSATVSDVTHKFTKLPRVLILHIKRYAFDTIAVSNEKLASRLDIPMFLTLDRHCLDTTVPCSALTESVKKVKFPGGNAFGGRLDRRSPSHFPAKPSLCSPRPSSAKRQLFTPSPLLSDDMELKSCGLTVSRTKTDWDDKTTRETSYKDWVADDDPLLQEVIEKSKTDISMSKANDEDDDDLEFKRNLEKALEESQLLAEEKEREQKQREHIALPIASDRISSETRKDRERPTSSGTSSSIFAQKENVGQSSSSVVEEPQSRQANSKAAASSCAEQNTFLAGTESSDRLSISDDEKSCKNDGSSPNSLRLVGIVSHVGSSSSFGHYVTDVWDSKNATWLCYDDSTVQKVQQENVLTKRQRNGYIFFYIAKNVDESQAKAQ